MEENEKKEKSEYEKELEMQKRTKEDTQKLICEILEEGINSNNVDFLGKVVDIHKDIANEEYWCAKEEIMRYRGYSEYGDDSYGRRGVPGTGRRSYRDGSSSYGRRGVPGTGRGRYRGEELMDEMMFHYGNYSDGMESYGAEDNETMGSFKQMIKSFKDFYKHLKKEAVSPEQMEMLEDTAREMMER